MYKSSRRIHTLLRRPFLTLTASGLSSFRSSCSFRLSPQSYFAFSDFYSEEQVLRKLSPLSSVVTILGGGFTGDGRPFLVLELLKSQNLRSAIGTTTCLRTRLSWSATVAGTLASLHAGVYTSGTSVLHRDIKPDNVGFCLETGEARLLDFGLVTALRSGESASGSGKTVAAVTTKGEKLYDATTCTGSIRYMSPEVALSRPYNALSEAYSFSVMLWQVVERRVPFEGMNVGSMKSNVFVGGLRPEFKEAMWRDILEVKDMVERGWSADIDARPNLKTFEEALTRARDRLPEGVGGWCCAAS